MDKYFIKEKIKDGIICTPYVTSKLQVADILTKGLLTPMFDFQVNKSGMLYIFSPS